MHLPDHKAPVWIDSIYLPPVACFLHWQLFDLWKINGDKNFVKSGFQNRCWIAGANGPMLLTIPVQGGRCVRKTVREVYVSYAERWQHRHWNSICSAYRRSRFFTYYEHHFKPFYSNRIDSLLELNTGLLHAVCEALHLSVHLETESPGTVTDRIDKTVQRVNTAPEDRVLPYYQVFQYKYAFLPGLSIIDLLFNEGPGATEYLQECLRPVAGHK